MDSITDIFEFLKSSFPSLSTDTISTAISSSHGCIDEALDFLLAYELSRSLESTSTDPDIMTRLVKLFPHLGIESIEAFLATLPDTDQQKDSFDDTVNLLMLHLNQKTGLRRVPSSKLEKFHHFCGGGVIFDSDPRPPPKLSPDSPTTKFNFTFLKENDYQIMDGKRWSFEDFREEANEFHQMRVNYIQKAAESFRRKGMTGKGAATSYSDQAREYGSKCDQYNRIAAELILHQNTPLLYKSTTIDLHHLTVAEATKVTAAFINHHFDQRGAWNCKTLHIITGYGKHSKAESRLSPAIWNLLNGQGRSFYFDGKGSFQSNGGGFDPKFEDELANYDILARSLFSKNEHKRDLSPRSIKFLLIDYIFGCVLESKGHERALHLQDALDFHFRFITKLIRYGLVLDEGFHAKLAKLLDSGDFDKGLSRWLSESSRQDKITRLRQSNTWKAEQDRILVEYQKIPTTDETIDLGDHDEQIILKYWKLSINLSLLDAFDRINLILMELGILMKTDSIDEPKRATLTPSCVSKVTQPFSLVSKREQATLKVFGPGYNLPTMTIDEYLELERKRGNIIDGGGPTSASTCDSNLDQDDDEAAFDLQTMKDRQFDEFKDCNEKKDFIKSSWIYLLGNLRGSGNLYNKG